MAEIEVNGHSYRLAKLSAMTQFHVSRRVLSVMSALGGDGGSAKGGDAAMARLFEAVGQMSDEDAEYVIGKCLADCRRQSGDAWAKVYVNGQLMFDDIGMDGMIKLTLGTLQDNLTGFFTGLGSSLGRAAT